MAPYRPRPARIVLGAGDDVDVQLANHVAERGPLDPPGVTSSVLDTLYHTAGGEAGSGWPVMTIYHGSQAPLFVFSGFPVWYFQRQQGIELVDFVLQRVWGMTRRPVAR